MVNPFCRFKDTVLGVFFSLSFLICVTVYVANRIGFSGGATEPVVQILKNNFIHSEIGSYRYSLWDGLVLSDLQILSREDDSKVCATFDRIAVNIDRKALIRGKFDPDSATISGGEAWIDLYDAEQSRIHLTELECFVDLSRGYDVVIKTCTGKLNGIPISINAESLGIMQPKDTKTKVDIPEVLRAIFLHIYRIKSAPGSDLAITVDLIHTYGAENGLDIDIDLSGQAFSYNDLAFQSIDAQLEYRDKTLFVNRLYATDDTGTLEASGTYYVPDRIGQYEVNSTTNLQKVLRSLSINTVAGKIVSPLPPTVTAKGTVTGTKQASGEVTWEVQTHGHLTVNEFRILGGVFSEIDTDFSWRNGQLFLKGMKVSHPSGEMTGKLLLDAETIRYQVTSSLPPSLYTPFTKPGGILANNIDKTTFNEQSVIDLTLKGTMQRNKIDEWEASGSVALQNFSYNGVPINNAECSFIFTPLEARFTDLQTSFDYSEYRVTSHVESRPSSGYLRADLISFDNIEQTVNIKELTGRAWPAQVVNLFHKPIAKAIYNTVHFTAPPRFRTYGTIGLEDKSWKTNLYNVIESPTDFYYALLGKDVRFSNTDGVIRIINNAIQLQKLTSSALGGSLEGEITVNPISSKYPAGYYAGEFVFNQVSLSKIADRYEFENKTSGHLTGRSSFSGKPANIRSVNGEGFIALDEADIFYIPVFGPLSPIMSGILGHKKTSHEKVKSVSASFQIVDGNVYTNDLTSNTPSAKIKGNGIIDLEKQEIDITVRASTKGLLGLVTLPLKPLEQLLQFRGTGPVSAPTWANSPFKSTPKYIGDTAKNKAMIAE